MGRAGRPIPHVAKQNTRAKTSIDGVDVEKGRRFWSFQPPKAATPPVVKDAAWPKTDVDKFVLAAIEAKGLKPVADAGRSTLLSASAST